MCLDKPLNVNQPCNEDVVFLHEVTLSDDTFVAFESIQTTLIHHIPHNDIRVLKFIDKK